MTKWNGMRGDAMEPGTNGWSSAGGSVSGWSATGWNRGVLRAYAPAVMCWFAAALALAWRERVQPGVASIELADVLQWSVIVLLLATVIHGSWVSWRLWQARQAAA